MYFQYIAPVLEITTARSSARSIALGVLVLLLLMAAGCGVHRITSKPSNASVFVYYSDEDAKPKPEEMIEVRNPRIKTTPIARGGGPSGTWYQVRKDDYEDSEIVYLPSRWTGEASHHFVLKRPKDARIESAARVSRGVSAILAVFDIEDVTRQLKEKEIQQVREFLETRLTELGRYRVVPRAELRKRLLQQKAESYRECFDEACQIELGRELAAEKTLATRILKVGDTCVVTSKLYDLKTAASEKAASARVACSPEGLLDGMDQLAKQLSAL